MNDPIPEGVLDMGRILAGRSFQRIAGETQLIESTTSTIDYVWSSCRDGAGDGFVVMAEHQSTGRGRMGRRWHSPRGASILCSLLLIETDRYPGPPAEMLGLIGGIATARAVIDATGVAVRIAWPNDIMVEDRKLAGVLVESRVLDTGGRAHAVGIGINCLQDRGHFPDAIRAFSTSLHLESAEPIVREPVAGALLHHLDAWLSDPSRWDAQAVASTFRECAAPFGQRVRLRHKGRIYTGRMIDVDPSAALVVMLDDGIQSVFPAAETTVLRGSVADDGS